MKRNMDYNETENLIKKHYNGDTMCAWELKEFLNKMYLGKKIFFYHNVYKLMISSNAFKKLSRHRCKHLDKSHYEFKIIRSNLGKNKRKPYSKRTTYDKPKLVKKQIKEFNERMKEKYSPKKPSTIKKFMIILLKMISLVFMATFMGLQIGLFLGAIIYGASLFI